MPMSQTPATTLLLRASPTPSLNRVLNSTLPLQPVLLRRRATPPPSPPPTASHQARSTNHVPAARIHVPISVPESLAATAIVAGIVAAAIATVVVVATIAAPGPMTA